MLQSTKSYVCKQPMTVIFTKRAPQETVFMNRSWVGSKRKWINLSIISYNELLFRHFWRHTQLPYYQRLVQQGRAFLILNDKESSDVISCQVSPLSTDCMFFLAWLFQRSYPDFLLWENLGGFPFCKMGILSPRALGGSQWGNGYNKISPIKHCPWYVKYKH